MSSTPPCATTHAPPPTALRLARHESTSCSTRPGASPLSSCCRSRSRSARSPPPPTPSRPCCCCLYASWWASQMREGTSFSLSHSSSAAAASCLSVGSADCAESAPRQRATPCSACTGALAPAKSRGCRSLQVAALSCARETCSVESGTSRHSASARRAGTRSAVSWDWPCGLRVGSSWAARSRCTQLGSSHSLATQARAARWLPLALGAATARTSSAAHVASIRARPPPSCASCARQPRLACSRGLSRSAASAVSARGWSSQIHSLRCSHAA
mmetsp:Transcript_48996/g.118066  ORF Transcript_48996/g.118066 Transcript_48996/m.118066 type:complete len:273 (+) Transcript_48996:354-1172(+)